MTTTESLSPTMREALQTISAGDAWFSAWSYTAFGLRSDTYEALERRGLVEEGTRVGDPRRGRVPILLTQAGRDELSRSQR